MAKIVAEQIHVSYGDTSLQVVFHLSITDPTLSAALDGRERQVAVTIPNSTPVSSYYGVIVYGLVDSFADLWPTTFILPSDIVLPGWQELIALGPEASAFVDDLIGASTTSGDIGQLGWATSGSPTWVAEDLDNHPGIITQQSSTPSSSSALYLPELWWPDVIEEFVAVVSPRTQGGSPTVSYVAWRVGLASSVTIDASFDGILLAMDNNSTSETQTWKIQAYQNGSATSTTDTGLTVTVGHWYELRIARINSTQFRVRTSDLTDRLLDSNGVTINQSLFDTGLTAVVMQQLYTPISTVRNWGLDYAALQVRGLTRI